MKITQFRKELFHTMDRVVRGELVEVVHKGNVIRLSPAAASRMKMSTLVQRDTLLCHPHELEQAHKDLQREMREEMEKDWTQI